MPEATDQRLRELFRKLPAAQREQLCDFADFLLARHGADAVVQEPLDIARPREESVVRAMQRLTATYPMVDTAGLRNEATELMNRHIMEGRAAQDVIDYLEALFQKVFRADRPGG